jgi:archaellum component FlaC
MKKTEYYVKIEDQEHGPLTLPEIRQLVRDQIIFSKTLIRNSNSDKFVYLETILSENAKNNIQSKLVSKKYLCYGGVICLLLVLFLYLEIKLNSNAAEIKAISNKFNDEQSGLLALQKSLSDVEQMIKSNKTAQSDILVRFDKIESSASQMANDYKLIKTTKDSIEALNNTVLQLKNSSESNNKLQIDSFKEQVSGAQSNYDELTKEIKLLSAENQRISKEFQASQKNFATLASYDKNSQEINKKINEIEAFNKLVIKDLNNHQAKLQSHEDWLKSISKR